jgi:hypothetical protein
MGVILISGGVGGFTATFPMPGLSLLLAVLVTVLLLPLLGVLLLDPSETVLFGEFLAAFVRALVNRDLAETLLGWFVIPDPESKGFVAEASGLERPNLRLTGEDSPSLMAVAMPSVERSFFFRVEGRLSLEALEGIGRLEVETPSLLGPEEGAAMGILESPASLVSPPPVFQSPPKLPNLVSLPPGRRRISRQRASRPPSVRDCLPLLTSSLVAPNRMLRLQIL